MPSLATLAAHRAAPLLLALLGALQTLALVHTEAWALPILAAALLVACLRRVGPGRAAWLGWCYGTAWIAAATWWMFISMHRYGGLPAPLAALAVLALAAALSLYLALACAAFARWSGRGPWVDALAFAAWWSAAELARGLLFTGFPWGASGYTQLDGPLAWAAPWVGVYGIGALLAFVAAAGAQARREGVLALLLFVPALLPLPEFTRPTGTLQVRLLQTNVAQDEKFRIDRMPASLAHAIEQLLASPADLVVGPETVVPVLPQQVDAVVPGAWDALLQRFAAGPQAALVGAPLGSEAEGYTNSVLGLGGERPAPAGAAGYRYDKHHLVPFGEFIPPGFRWFTQMMNIPLGDFNRGARVQPSFAVRGQRLAPNICYEDLFGEELAQRFASAATAPTVLVNLSNIGWFGDSIAVPQHLNISRLRSLELQRPMLRATNTGATAIIDHRGQVLARLQPFTRGVLDGGVQGREGLTPYARWASQLPPSGLWLLPLLLGTLAVLAQRFSRRSSPRSPRH